MGPFPLRGWPFIFLAPFIHKLPWEDWIRQMNSRWTTSSTTTTPNLPNSYTARGGRGRILYRHWKVDVTLSHSLIHAHSLFGKHFFNTCSMNCFKSWHVWKIFWDGSLGQRSVVRCSFILLSLVFYMGRHMGTYIHMRTYITHTNFVNVFELHWYVWSLPPPCVPLGKFDNSHPINGNGTWEMWWKREKIVQDLKMIIKLDVLRLIFIMQL